MTDIKLGTDDSTVDAGLQARLKELEAERHKWSSSEGRLRKEQEAHAAAKKRIEELEQELAEVRSIPQENAFNDFEQVKTVFGDEAPEVFRSVIAPLVSEINQVKQTLAQTRQEEALNNVRRNYNSALREWEANTGRKGLLDRVTVGGDLREKWEGFCKAHPTALSANANLDSNTMSAMLDLFVSDENIVFEPTASVITPGGGQPGGQMGGADGGNYTPAHYSRDIEAIEKLYRSGQMSREDYNKKWQEAKTLLFESQQKLHNTGGMI